MNKAGRVNRRQRAAEIGGDVCELPCVEWAVRGEFGFERPADHELHPHAGAIANSLRAVDGDDVWMTHARCQTAFMDDERVIAAVSIAVPQQLERDLAMQA